ncbi:hypothetical protein EDF76_1636 [Raoultella terrigena]|nr:hypothetical protein EDF76_1636 [Raoultella terrigena]
MRWPARDPCAKARGRTLVIGGLQPARILPFKIWPKYENSRPIKDLRFTSAYTSMRWGRERRWDQQAIEALRRYRKLAMEKMAVVAFTSDILSYPFASGFLNVIEHTIHFLLLKSQEFRGSSARSGIVVRGPFISLSMRLALSSGASGGGVRERGSKGHVLLQKVCIKTVYKYFPADTY